jgi:NADPH:quinone reductase-like Zn-dependent oxidoreductase
MSNKEKMKAIVYEKYGPPEVLQLKEVEKPTLKHNEILIEVHASSVTYNNTLTMTGKNLMARLYSGLREPKYKILGNDVAGRVEAVGVTVKQFQPGDEVFGDIGRYGFGAYAEYVSVSENASLALKPTNLTFEEAAAVPEAAFVALHGLRDKGQIQSGQNVLIVGASGGIGTFAVQIAKSFGAEVTGVCSTRNVDMVRSIGADQVIDYTQEDFAQNEGEFDLILATAGYRSIFDYKRALNPKGIYVCSGGSMDQVYQSMFLGPLISLTGSKKMGSFLSVATQEDLVFIKGLIETCKVAPVIDRRYSLSEVPEAFRYYDEGHSQGKVVINVKQNSKR